MTVCLYLIMFDTVQATPGLVLPEERTTGLGCIPEGRTVSYQCTVIDSQGIGSTTWLGSAFNCSDSSPRIIVLHSQFMVAEHCSYLSAVGVLVNMTLMEYTSELTLTANAELSGGMINCTLSAVVAFGSDTIKVGG